MDLKKRNQGREIICTRFFPVEPSTIFTAFSDPAILSLWWGPAGFTNTFHEFDFRPGGRWRFTMHGPGKGNYENECEFEIIEEPLLITWKRHSKPLFKVVFEFERAEQGTQLTFRQVFETGEECEKIRKYTVGKNDENFDRLEKELGKER